MDFSTANAKKFFVLIPVANQDTQTNDRQTDRQYRNELNCIKLHMQPACECVSVYVYIALQHSFSLYIYIFGWCVCVCVLFGKCVKWIREVVSKKKCKQAPTTKTLYEHMQERRREIEIDRRENENAEHALLEYIRYVHDEGESRLHPNHACSRLKYVCA